MMSEEYSKLIRRSFTSRNMKPLEVWTCQRADNLKKKSSKIKKNNYAATMVSAARRQIIGGGAPINKSRRRRPQIVAAGARLYSSAISPRKKKGLKKARSRGQRYTTRRTIHSFIHSGDLSLFTTFCLPQYFGLPTQYF